MTSESDDRCAKAGCRLLRRASGQSPISSILHLPRQWSSGSRASHGQVSSGNSWKSRKFSEVARRMHLYRVYGGKTQSSGKLRIFTPDGQVWWHDPDQGKLLIVDLDSDSGRQKEYPVRAPITSIEVSASAQIWCGHADGSLSVRAESQQNQLCPDLQLFSSPVTAIAIDIYGAVWVGSHDGTVKIVSISSQRRQAGIATTVLSERQALRPAAASIATSLAGDLTPHAVHAGPVSVIEMYNDRVWTSGSGALAGSLLEWDLTGQSHAETDITRIGPMTALAVLPLMSASRKEDSDPATVGTSELKDWILASAHQSGAIVLWDPHANTCAMPVVYLHPATGPCRSIVFLEALGLWCAAYENGDVMVQPVASLQLSLHCNPPQASVDDEFKFTRLQAYAYGLCTAAGTDSLLITTGLDGSINAWNEAGLLSDNPAVPAVADFSPVPPSVHLTDQLIHQHFTPANSAIAIDAVQRAVRDDYHRRSLSKIPSFKPASEAESDSSDPSKETGESSMSRSDAKDLLLELVHLLRPRTTSAEVPSPSDKSSDSVRDAKSSHSSILAVSPHSDPFAPAPSVPSGDLSSQSPTLPMSSPKQAAEPSKAWNNIFSQQASMNWIIPFHHLALIRKVAEGGIGQVYLAHYQETEVAVKVLTALKHLQGAAAAVPEAARANSQLLGKWLASDAATSHSAVSILRSLQQEVGIMSSIRHPNVVMFMGMSIDPPCVVSEWCSRGSLCDILGKAREQPALAAQLTWPRRLQMALDAARGLFQLHQHSPQIVHADVKSPNFVCDAFWRVKVTDFNLSRLVDAQGLSNSLVANNPRWQAPEVIARQEFSTHSDAFSFGVVLWELITWQLPWGDLNPFSIMRAVSEQGQRLDLPQGTGHVAEGGGAAVLEGLSALIQRCWADIPAERPDFGAIITELRALLDACRGPSLRGNARRRSDLAQLHAAASRSSGSSTTSPSKAQVAASGLERVAAGTESEGWRGQKGGGSS